jgi:hypothetical protein
MRLLAPARFPGMQPSNDYDGQQCFNILILACIRDLISYNLFLEKFLPVGSSDLLT